MMRSPKGCCATGFLGEGHELQTWFVAFFIYCSVTVAETDRCLGSLFNGELGPNINLTGDAYAEIGLVDNSLANVRRTRAGSITGASHKQF